MDQANVDPQKLLIVEDNQELAAMVAEFLSQNGYRTSVEHNGLKAVERIRREAFDAVILDIGLPGMDGTQVCKTIRPHFNGPILMLTARASEVDEVSSLEFGADDYMSKPVRPRALLARLTVHLKRAGVASNDCSDVVEVGGLQIDPTCREITLNGQQIEMTTAEYELLMELAQHAGTVVPRAEIYEKLNGIKYDGLDRSIDLRVSRVRKKLGDDPQNPSLIKSVRGVGYILVAKI